MAPTVPMRFLPGDLQVAAADADQTSSSIARGGDRYRAVWTDSRANQDTPDVFGARLEASGGPIDASSLAISLDIGPQNNTRVAWNGSNWLVTWVSQGDVFAAFVSADGTPAPQFNVSSSYFSNNAPAVAAAGDTALIVWQDSFRGGFRCRIPRGTVAR